MNLHRSIASALILAALWAGGIAPAGAVALDKSFVAQTYLDTSLGGTTFAARPELGGTVLEDVLQPFSAGGVTGTVQNRVVREDGTGTLDFYWRITVDPSQSAVGANTSGFINAFRLGDFGYDAITDADWRIDGLGTSAPNVARVFNPASYPGGDINFLFTDGVVDANNSSRFFFLHTSATDYAQTASYDLLCGDTGCLSGSYATFAPAVPEPQTYALMLAGLALVGWAARRRRAE